MKYTLPEDIKKYEKRSKCAGAIVSAVTVTVALGVLAALIALTIGKGVAHTALLAAFYIIVVGAVLVWSKIPKRFIDRTFFGKITAVEVDSRRKSDAPEKPTLESFRTYHTVKITVEQPDGKTVRREVASLRNAAVDTIDDFKVGDEVFHLYGTEVTVVFPKAGEKVICAVCGETNGSDDEKCRACGHTLIKKIDFK